MSVRSPYTKFTDALGDASRDWERHFVLPYSSAYNTAYLSYEKIIEKQKESDKEALERKMQLALFALSLCGGSILTHVFGSAVLKEVATKVAVDTIINRGMERSFKAAAYVERNKTAQFMLGELWGKGEGWVGDKIKEGVNKVTKNQLEENSHNYSSLSEFSSHPMNMENNLKKWVLNLAAISSTVGQMIADTSNEETVIKPLNILKSSYFFTAAPKESINEEPVSEDIELTFYMKYILDLDYIVKGYVEHIEKARGGYTNSTHITGRAGISQNPTNPHYPISKEARDWSKSQTDFEQVKYKGAGDIIRQRINALYNKKFASDFFRKNEKISHDTLVRAEITLNMLEGLNHNKILKTLTQIKM